MAEGLGAGWDIIETGDVMAATATYLYCIVRSISTPRAARAPKGLPGATAPSIVPLWKPLWMVVADVPLAAYGAGALESSLRDLEWVSDVALAHEAVVEHFSRQPEATVVPMKLFTMFSSVDRASDEMTARRAGLAGIFRRVAGCEEWGVRIGRRAPARPRGAAAPAPTTGSGFLLVKKQVRDDARALARTAAETADGTYAALARIAKDARRRDDVPAGAVSPPLLDAAFLVPAARRARFKAEAKRLAAGSAKAGLAMTLTGPWPAYNFVQQERG